ncbi:MAG: glycoside hydrolase family 5 protein [Chitinophagaceae bacterium]|nr:glycoside hydrolase family 5 protein [Chitinophagaceae bacterium]
MTTQPLYPSSVSGKWSAERSQAWLDKNGWLVGCNFVPSNAANQLEMWQADTFSLELIDKELGWAAALGFNTVRVFLHNLVWEQDPSGYLKRIDEFLTVADNHGIRTMFVLFDAVWDPFPKAGIQRSPSQGIHNSAWVQSPGFDILNDVNLHDSMRPYVDSIVGHFKNDERVIIWDIFNEPDNVNAASYNDRHYSQPKADLTLNLMSKAFGWVREINPIQPLTSAPWQTVDWSNPAKLSKIDAFMFNESDVLSFHCYEGKVEMEKRLTALAKYNKPMFCTEYMARSMNSTFEEILPLLKKYSCGAYNWGFVEGKSQTHLPWDSWATAYSAEPELWFHDIYRSNGEAYITAEVEFLKQMLSKNIEQEVPLHQVA